MYRFSIRKFANAIAACVLVTSAVAQAAPATPTSTTAAAPHNAATHEASFRNSVTIDPRARKVYMALWGVDSLSVKTVESGEMVRFSYTVLNPEKAAQLNDKKATPSLIDFKAGVSLVVPSMEKVGQLRQSSTPEAGRSYWMVFSNKGGKVKPGDRVSVVIGKFRADGLIVQ